MDAAGRQTTLHDFGLAPPPTVQTEPPTYLNHNDLPKTEPTYIAAVPPAPTTTYHATRAPPETEPTTLDRYRRPTCPFCSAHPENREKHLLVAHPAEVSQHISDRAANASGQAEPDDEPRSAPIAASGPAMFGEVDTEAPPGQRVDGYTDPRACDDCGTRMSAPYANVFAQEDGTLWCPDCRPRSVRYSRDPVYSDDHQSDPSTVTGSSNARSHAHRTPSWREASEPS